MKPWKGLKSYSPDLHILEGNHDGCSDCVGTRMYRYVEEHPELDGAVPQPLDCWEKAGWKLHHFLEPAVLDGVFYSHLFPLTSTGNVTPSSLRYGASSAMAQLKNNRVSCIAGHKPGIDTAGPIAGLNGRIRAIQAGSFYMHDEVYRGNGGNDYWRGCLMLHRVKDGNFSVTEVDLDYLLEKYAG